ncbi:MAG: pentapeptide repeat-containing protein [Spirulinaceae cyanobacterium]
MVDQSQLGLLKRSVKEWNKWRFNNPRLELELSYANLNYLNLRNSDLSYANLSYANLRGVDLDHADLIEANLRSANLGKSNLRSSDLSYANLGYANLSYANLRSSNLRNSSLRGADLIETDLRGAELQEANLIEADLRGADLRGADLIGADLSSVQALGTNFQNANLTGACIQDWNINSGTQFAQVICKCIYLKYEHRKAEIQQLLEQLEKSYPTETTTGKMQLATEAIARIENNPSLKAKIISSLKAGSIAAFEQFLNHPAASFVIAAFEEFKQ